MTTSSLLRLTGAVLLAAQPSHAFYPSRGLDMPRLHPLNVAGGSGQAFNAASGALSDTAAAASASISSASATLGDSAAAAGASIGSAGAVLGDSAAAASASITAAVGGVAGGASAAFVDAGAAATTGVSAAAAEAAAATSSAFLAAGEAATAVGAGEATAVAALAVAFGALATKQQETKTVAALQNDRDSLEQKLNELEDKFFQADMQFEQVTGAMRAEFDTTLKVKLDTLRQELRREKDLAIQELKNAQESQLEELREFYTNRYTMKVAEMTKLLDEKDQRIIELEAQLGDPLALWWQQTMGGKKKKNKSSASVSEIRTLKAGKAEDQ